MALYIHITRCDYDAYFDEVSEQNVFNYGAGEVDTSSYKSIELEEWLELIEADEELRLTNLHDAFWTGAAEHTLYSGEEYLFQFNRAGESGCNAISVRTPDKETMAYAARIAQKLQAQIIYEGSDELDEIGRLQYDFRNASNKKRYIALLDAQMNSKKASKKDTKSANQSANKSANKNAWWKFWE